MVSKITFFEGHFENVQFGPASVHGPAVGDAGVQSESDADQGEQTEEDTDAGEQVGAHVDAGDEDADTEPKSVLVTVLQGATVFAVLFAILWTVLSRLLGDDQSA